MWSKLIRFFKDEGPSRDDLEVCKGEILEELEGLKKTLRRQSLFLETFKKETLAMMEERDLRNAEPLLKLAESFFHFDSSLKAGGLTSAQEEAAEMVWNKLEFLLSGLGMELIRRAGEPFDPRLHEVLEKVAEPEEELVVSKVIEPGYVYQGRVVRPARVIIGELSTTGKQEL